jgi:predicted lactoylglutathione lyase
MNKSIIVNMPVKDLEKSKAFFSALGYTFNPAFTGEHAACMIVAENSIQVMLMTQAFCESLTPKRIIDTRESIEMWINLSCESAEEVDSQMDKVLAAGGTAVGEAEDCGFMYAHGFEDLDGHSWQLNYMRGLPG